MIHISSQALARVNSIRQRAGLPAVDEERLGQLLDWTDLPRGTNLRAACLPRFSKVLGSHVTSNADGGYVYICVDSRRNAVELGAAIDAAAINWTEHASTGPRDYLGWTLLLPDDVVQLANEASRAVRDAWWPPLR